MKKYNILSILLFVLAVISAIYPLYAAISYLANDPGVPFEPTDLFLILSSLSCFSVFGGLTLHLKYELTKD